MDNVLPKESLLFIVMALVGYGMKVIDTNTLIGIGCMIVGAGLIVLRAYLKKKGWEIAGK